MRNNSISLDSSDCMDDDMQDDQNRGATGGHGTAGVRGTFTPQDGGRASRNYQNENQGIHQINGCSGMR